MKNLTRAALPVLLMIGCMSAPAFLVETEGAFQRTTVRVVERHNAYVVADESLSDADEASALAESSQALALALTPQVLASAMSDALEPVAARHDAYVFGDTSFDFIERDIYLEDTERLRSVLDKASSFESN